MEAATNAAKHPLYRERYQATKRRLGRQRGAKVAQVQLARKLAEAIWQMLTRDQPFAPAGAASPLAAETALIEMRHRSDVPYRPGRPPKDAREMSTARTSNPPTAPKPVAPDPT